MRKLLISGIITATVIGVAGVIFYACNKEMGNSSNAQTQITNGNTVHKMAHWDKIMFTSEDGCIINFYNNGNNLYLIPDCGYWYYVNTYDAAGNVTGGNWFYVPCGPSTTKLSSSPINDNGVIIVQQQIIDIKNAVLDERQYLVTNFENSEPNEEDIIRLSTVIGMELVKGVIQGNFIISDITEKVYENTADGIKYEYTITFSTSVEGETIVKTVSFSYDM